MHLIIILYIECNFLVVERLMNLYQLKFSLRLQVMHLILSIFFHLLMMSKMPISPIAIIYMYFIYTYIYT